MSLGDDLMRRPDDPAPVESPTLHEDALYGIAGEVVRGIEPYTEASSAALLADLLASTGNTIGPRPHAIAEGDCHPARLFVLLAGQSAKARKGSARSQIHRLMCAACPEWAPARVLTGLSSGEGLIKAIDDRDKRLLVFELSSRAPCP